jgi:hypothetical protein
MTSLETHLRAIEQTADRGATVAFFDLDRTLIAGYSILALAIHQSCKGPAETQRRQFRQQLSPGGQAHIQGLERYF